MTLAFERPSDRLLKEFEAVARRAATFGDALGAKTNQPMTTLPVMQLEEILVVLKALPRGTAEGGRLQLDMADARLNEIRMEYFSLGDDQDAGFMRDVPLDDSLSLLIAATRTALSAANREAGIRQDGMHRPPSIEAEGADREVAGAIDRGDEAIEGIGNAQRDGKRILQADSAAGDRLMRRLNDAAGLARQARVELQWSDMVSEWIRKLAYALSKAPQLIRAAADAMDLTVDVALAFYDQWKTFQDDLESVARKHLPIFTDNLRKAADRLEGRRGSERILFVDDEETVRHFGTSALAQSGWSVQSAGSGREALDLGTRNVFDILVTDIVMPDRDGMSLARELRRQHRKLKVLIVSGYAERSVIGDALDLGYNFLPKPYSLDQLNHAVSQTLEGKRWPPGLKAVSEAPPAGGLQGRSDGKG